MSLWRRIHLARPEHDDYIFEESAGEPPSIPAPEPLSTRTPYTYNQGNQRTQVLRTGENYADYGCDKIGQVTNDIAFEANGGPARLKEQLAYAFDPAGGRANPFPSS